MEQNQDNVIPIPVEDEIKESYLNYAMSVIVSRALPDVRDGLKPVHRRILYAMNEMGLRYNTAFKKCGRIVGDVLGKYHPHGDQSIYDALVRMAQPFSLRYPVVRGQGNFGSLDGDPPAAMRYTEAKMERIAEAMLADIKKDTVDFGPNYDDTMQEPLVLPAAFPFLLVNGANGIAVGMATNLPPNNLREICQGIEALIKNPQMSFEELLQIVKGPDFPTAGIIYGRRGIRKAYKTGHGKVTVRARCEIEEMKGDRERIVFTEIPYLVNKADLVVKIAALVKDKKIDGISDLRDESDRKGIRIVIELKKGIVTKVVLNKLFSLTKLQVNFNVNSLALVDGMPRVLSLKEMMQCFIEHRKEVIIRRTRYDLAKAEERAHILEGLKIALENIDEVIKIIKSSSNVVIARNSLMDRFKLSEIQAQAILDMRLQKLTSLETQKIIEELEELLKLIEYYKDLLANEYKILNLVKEETHDIAEKYGDDRRTEIIPDEIEDFCEEDMIQKENMVVVITNKGFIKRVPLSAYKNQGRGGKGSSSGKLRDEDFVEHLFIASTHDYVLFVTSAGKAYWLKVYEIPGGSRISSGKHLRTLLGMSLDEDITAIVALQEFSDDYYIFMTTLKGIVKRVSTYDFRYAKSRGIKAINLDDDDRLISALLTEAKEDIMLVSKNGKTLRINCDQVRTMGRTARGVCGLRLQDDDEIAGAITVMEGEMIIVSEYGYGKRMEFDLFTPHSRATKGQIGYKTSESTGKVIGVLSAETNDDLVCITSQGKSLKLNIKDISSQGRSTKGVRIVNVDDDDSIVSIASVSSEE